VNQPDKIIFVGEALVGNEAVDQLSKFDRALKDFSNGRGIDGMLVTKWDTVDDKVRFPPFSLVSGLLMRLTGWGRIKYDIRYRTTDHFRWMWTGKLKLNTWFEQGLINTLDIHRFEAAKGAAHRPSSTERLSDAVPIASYIFSISCIILFLRIAGLVNMTISRSPCLTRPLPYPDLEVAMPEGTGFLDVLGRVID
jgi:hypothetical protein